MICDWLTACNTHLDSQSALLVSLFSPNLFKGVSILTVQLIGVNYERILISANQNVALSLSAVVDRGQCTSLYWAIPAVLHELCRKELYCLTLITEISLDPQCLLMRKNIQMKNKTTTWIIFQLLFYFTQVLAKKERKWNSATYTWG